MTERAKKIAPFLTYDRDPYLTISEGRLVWMQDVYLTSSRYPYSTSAGGVNYIRNAVKATIDAYHGRVVFHLVDPSDPIAAWAALVLLGSFTKQAQEELRAVLSVPSTLIARERASAV